MKKILFVVSSLNCGGINRALENFTTQIIESENPINIYALDSTGQYSNGFENSTLIKPGFLIDHLTRGLADQTGFNKLISAAIKQINRFSKDFIKTKLRKGELKKLARNNYDTVIAFSEGLPTHFLANFECRNKIAWIHCDYKSHLSFFGSPEAIENDKRAYSQYNSIVCVSDFTKESFEDECPQYKGRVYSIPNVLDTEMMKSSAVGRPSEYQDGFNIVTVGRIDPVKRPSVIPKILADILKAGIKVNWYIVGPTIWQSEYDKLHKEIDKYNVADNIHILGERSNPYPYIKSADLLVNTSVSEACPYVVNEAKVLGTPVVCTNFGSAGQFITNGESGFYEPIETLSEPIIKLLSDRKLYDHIRENLANFSYDNKAIIDQILALTNK